MNKALFTSVLAVLIAIAGSAIADEAATSMSMVVEGEATGQTFIGLTPEGLRLDSYTTGVITEGLLAGATTTGVDYLLFRHDGVGVIDIRAHAEGPDGAVVAVTIKGFLGEPSPGLLEAMLDPEFESPDVDIPLHGAAWMQTMSPEYAFLNHTVFGMTGTANLAQGVVRMTFRSLAGQAR